MFWRVTHTYPTMTEAWHCTEREALVEVADLRRDPDATDIRLWVGDPARPADLTQLPLPPKPADRKKAP